MELSHFTYGDGIRFAEAQDPPLITRHGEVRSDYFAHLSGHLKMDFSNSRDMYRLARQLITVGRDANSGDDCNVCLLGAGTGWEAAHTDLRGTRVTTVALTDPINPYLRPLIHLDDVTKELHQILATKKLQWAHRNTIHGILQGKEKISVDFLLCLQHAYGVRFYETLADDEPFIERQYIGDFANAPIADDQRVVYEHTGATFYSADIPAATEKALSLVGDAGVLFYSTCRPLTAATLKNIKNPGDMLFRKNDVDKVVLLREGHPLMPKLPPEAQRSSQDVKILERMMQELMLNAAV